MRGPGSAMRVGATRRCFLTSANRRISSSGESEYHGAGGPLPVSALPDRHALCDAFIAAAGEIGIPRNDDFNGEHQEGAGYYHTTARRGRRASCAVAYLRPARKRANLRVQTEALVTRIRFEGTRAVGVDYQLRGMSHTVRAHREVLLCGGSFNSPQLLQLSGVGPQALLERHGIPVVLDAAGVGEGLQDHFYVRTVWKCTQPITFNDEMASVAGRISMGLRYVLLRRGPLTVSAGYAGAFLRTRPELSRPDVQLYLINFSTDKMGTTLHPFSGFTVSMSPLRPESRGFVRIRSADPRVAPAIQYNYLTTANDRRTAIDGLKGIRALMQASAMKPFVLAEHAPGDAVQTDDAWLDYARQVGGTVYHPTSTCRMGQDRSRRGRRETARPWTIRAAGSGRVDHARRRLGQFQCGDHHDCGKGGRHDSRGRGIGVRTPRVLT